ncbi:MAG: F0F1 ATP synthase subunit B [Gammaproteobacteria bacterium]|nr:F0F1 ATP synthase subunit B [Gammaproteobacteria bacterium]
MSINATLLAQMVVFALLIWFTMKFVWPMLLGAMKARESRIAEGLAAAEQGQKDLAEAEARKAEVLKESNEQAQERIANAQRRADEIIEEARAEARAKADKLIEDAMRQIEQERNEARESLRGEVATLAIRGAEQILQREVDAKAHSESLSKLAAQL